MAVGSYGFKNVVCLVDGVALSGFSDGDTPISVERNKDALSLLVGADGDAAALFDADRSGLATVSLLQTSKSNLVLTAKLQLQEAGVFSPFPFVVRDTNGNDLVLAEAAFLVGPPRAAFGQGHNAREWRLLLPAVDIYMAGAA